MLKKLSTLTFISLLAILGNLNLHASDKIEKYIVDLERSQIFWGASKIGGHHEGTIKIKSGTITLKNGYLMDAEFVVDATSITNTDLKDPNLNKKLVDHLKSAEFFDVTNFPEIKFKLTKPDRKLDQNYLAKGNLTIKNLVSEVKFPLTLKIDGNEIYAGISFIFDRTKHNMKFNSKKFTPNIGDKMIYDEVDVNLYIYAKRQ